MKFDNLGEINYLAVLVAGIVTFLIGGAWYTALFGKTWARVHGYSDEKLKEMQSRRPMPVFFGIMILCYLVLAFVMAVIYAAAGVKTWQEGAVMGLLLWLGPAACIQLTGHISSDKPFAAYQIDLGYQLIYLVLIGAILGGWR